MSGAPEKFATGRVTRERGFTLVSAIFLVVMLALLSAYLVNLRVYQDTEITLDALATRAYATARSGAEWGAYNALRNNTCAASTTVALGGMLSAFTAIVTCTRNSFNEAGSTVNVDTIVATACNSATCPQATPGPLYVERQITVTVSK